MALYITKNDLDNDIKFYKNLGYTAKQAKYLATHVMGTEIKPLTNKVNNKSVDKGFKTILRGNAGTLSKSFNINQPTATVDGCGSLDCGIEAEYDNFMTESCVEFKEAGISDYVEDTHTFDLNTYKNINEIGFRSTNVSPTSTFSSTVNTASIGTLRNKLNTNKEITKSMVRIEEVLNFFDYDFRGPKTKKFNINAEICSKYNSDNKLMLIGLKGIEVKTPRQNIVLLIDTSGSMGERYTCKKLQKSIMTIVKSMNTDDILSIVTYSNTDKVVARGIKISDNIIDDIIKTVTSIEIHGCTNGSAGINMAYELSKNYFIENGSNRVILMTDGDFNFGTYSIDGLNELIIDKKKEGSFLTTIGFDSYSFSDATMDNLARNGNGNYFKITDDFDIIEILKTKFNSNTVVIAKDVKVQVEFNPGIVKRYRLIGYETRNLNHEDFKDDKVEAEPVGSGHTVVALYELELGNSLNKQDLKYSEVHSKSLNDEVCTISVRYKEPDEDVSKQISKPVKLNILDMTNNMKIAYCVMLICETFRSSEYSSKGDLTKALDIIDSLDNKESEKVKILRSLVNKIHTS